MCIREIRASLLCGHTSSYTTHCLLTTPPMRGILPLLPTPLYPIHSVTESLVNYHEICHTCRRFFLAANVTEEEGKRRCIEYREKHDFSGMLRPVKLSAGQVVVVREGLGVSEFGKALREAEENLKDEQNEREIMRRRRQRGMGKINPNADLEEGISRTTSTETLWPTDEARENVVLGDVGRNTEQKLALEKAAHPPKAAVLEGREGAI